MSLRRLVVALSAVSLMAAGCSPGEAPETPTELDEVGLRIDRLHRQMARVASAQDRATAGLRPVLEAVRELDAFVAGMRDPERMRTVEDTWPRVDGAFSAADPEGLREPLVEVAVEVDSARVTLARAREALPEAWERSYLDAEDAVLVAVRHYAEETDALVQILQRHWPTYEQVHRGSAAFVEANEFYRSSAEAVQAYEVRIGRSLGPLAGAQEEIGRFREAHAEAAAAVNRASREAEGAWEARPAPTASPAR